MIPLSFITTQEIVKLLETINKPISASVSSDSDSESDKSESSQLQPLSRDQHSTVPIVPYWDTFM